MSKDEIIRMAREAGIDAESDTLTRYEGFVEPLTRFANLVAAAEREECAKLVEPGKEHRRDARWGYVGGNEGVELLDKCAAAIRARTTT